MRILFTFAGGQGHLDPLVPLARAAAASGHDVAVTGRAELLASIEQRGLVALEPPGDQPDPAARMPLKDVAGAIRRVLDDPSYAAAASHVRDEILALPSAAEAIARLA